MALGNKTLQDLLGPITKQLNHEAVAESVELPEWEFKAQRVTDGMTHEQLVDKFQEEAEKVRTEVVRCSADGLAAAIAAIVGKGVPETGEACTVIAADDDRFAQCGLYDAIKAQELVTDLTVWDSEQGEECIQAALTATYGITYTTGGIAESATVVQPTSPKCGRAVSLLPLAHIAVVDASAIVPTMFEVMKEYEDKGEKLPSQVCFISGPSATADIELVRVEGVHGPMYVNYVIVE